MYLTIDVMVLYSYKIKWNKYCFEPKNSIVAHPPCLDYTVINPITTFSFLASHHALKDMFLRFDCCAQIWEKDGGQEYMYGVQAVRVIGARLVIRSGKKFWMSLSFPHTNCCQMIFKQLPNDPNMLFELVFQIFVES